MMQKNNSSEETGILSFLKGFPSGVFERVGNGFKFLLTFVTQHFPNLSPPGLNFTFMQSSNITIENDPSSSFKKTEKKICYF